jgi:hypothetical protein
MRKITIHNYEAYVLDYLDDKLDNEMLIEMKDFLNHHPDIKENIEGLEYISIKQENIFFPDKMKLLKNEESQNIGIGYFDYLCISDIENDIHKEEKKELNNLLKNDPSLIEIWMKYARTKLKPDENIIFPRKHRIRRIYYPSIFSISSSLAAAVILLFIGIFYFNSLKEYPKTGISNSNIVIDYNTNKSVKRNLYINESEVYKNMTLSHSQKKDHNDIDYLAFNDTVPPEIENYNKESNIPVPELKTEACIFAFNEVFKVNSLNNMSLNTHKTPKHIFWRTAEKGVDIWKFITSDDDLRMTNSYKKDGSIERLAISTDNLKFSKTFNKTNSFFAFNQ